MPQWLITTLSTAAPIILGLVIYIFCYYDVEDIFRFIGWFLIILVGSIIGISLALILAVLILPYSPFSGLYILYRRLWKDEYEWWVFILLFPLYLIISIFVGYFYTAKWIILACYYKYDYYKYGIIHDDKYAITYIDESEKNEQITENSSEEKNSKNDKKNSVQNNFDLSIEKLKQLNEFMQRKIIGQHKVIEKIHDLLVSNFYDLEETNRPAGVFFFVGPTGVGKTETAKVLSEFLYNHENINRFDMSEYKQDTAINKLIGADNGFVGYEEGGILINKMKKNPNSIILFDEIEKAHSTVLDLFLQILDEGFVTSNQGKKISFSNNIIIFTSNIGASAIFDTMNYNQIDEIIKLEVNNYFVNEINRPEVLGRIGKENIITFNLIQKKEHMFNILDIHFKNFINAFKKQGITLSFNKEIVYTNILIDVDKTKGARDIRNEFEQFKKHFNKALFQNEIQILDLKSKTLIFSYDNVKVDILSIE